MSPTNQAPEVVYSSRRTAGDRPDEVPRFHRAFTFDVEGAALLAIKTTDQALERPVGDMHLSGLARGLHPRRDIYHVAPDVVVEAVGTNHAGDDCSGIEPHAELKPNSLHRTPVHEFAHVAGGPAERIVATRGAGEIVGELAILSQAGRSATVRATVPTVVRALDWHALEDELSKVDPFIGSLLRQLSDKLIETTRD